MILGLRLRLRRLLLPNEFGDRGGRGGRRAEREVRTGCRLTLVWFRAGVSGRPAGFPAGRAGTAPGRDFRPAGGPRIYAHVQWM